MSFYVRPVTREDLPEVTEIDREAFPTQWPPADYGYEFKNQMAHYYVACDSDRPVNPPPRRTGWLDRLLHRPAPGDAGVEPRHYIVGFVGFWIMAGEAHITSIAVRQNYRRRGIGELLLAKAIDMAIEMDADIVTLEVRVSNAGAQALYEKYGFKRVGERRKYYLDRGPAGDTREDAIIMTTDSIKSEDFKRQFGALKSAHKLR